MIKIIECPRDAMQGIHEFIPTQTKIDYINQLLKVGFHTIDFGSFVSPKAIPQLRDTAEVLKKLNLSKTKSKLLAIVANKRGAEDAQNFEEINYLGYPFSISETFQKRNTNASIDESLKRVEEIQQICKKSKKTLVVYISMAFGNPYGDKYNPEIALNWCYRLANELEIEIIALSDTIGSSTPELIDNLFTTVIPNLNNVEIGAHLHTTPTTWQAKMEAALSAQCKRFDGALLGYGGCPMATDKLTGNMPTEQIVYLLNKMKIETNINVDAFEKSKEMAHSIFIK